jgi:hypothetical protein
MTKDETAEIPTQSQVFYSVMIEARRGSVYCCAAIGWDDHVIIYSTLLAPLSLCTATELLVLFASTLTQNILFHGQGQVYVLLSTPLLSYLAVYLFFSPPFLHI